MSNKFHIGVVGPCNPYEYKQFLGEENLFKIHENASSVNTFIKELLFQGYRVSVFSLYEGCERIVEYHSEQLNIYLIPRCMKIKVLSNFSPLYTIFRISSVIKKHEKELDVLHAQWTYEYACAAQCFEKKKKVFCTVRDWCPFVLSFQTRFTSKVLWFIKYFIYLNVMHSQKTCFIANSEYTKSCILNAYPQKNIDVIPNPIQKEIFKNAKHLDCKYTFISICNGIEEPRKNIITLLRAFAIYKRKHADASLCLIGKYNPNSQFQKNAEKENLLDGVFFAGSKSHQEVFDYIDQSYCLVHPSKEETFGNILLEGIARKTLCIGGKNSGAVPQVLGNGKFGILCDVNNAESLCYAMEKAQDKDLYDRLVADAYDYVKSHYSSDVIVDKTIQIYKKYLTE